MQVSELVARTSGKSLPANILEEDGWVVGVLLMGIEGWFHG
jgi:hypothetical protein